MRPDDAIGLPQTVVSWIPQNVVSQGGMLSRQHEVQKLPVLQLEQTMPKFLQCDRRDFGAGPPSYILISSCRSYVEPLLTEAELRTTKSGASIMLWDCFGGLSSHAGRVQL